MTTGNKIAISTTIGMCVIGFALAVLTKARGDSIGRRIRRLGGEVEYSEDTMFMVDDRMAIVRLQVTHNSITDVDLVEIAGCGNIESLSIASDSISDSGLQHLSKLRTLRDIGIDSRSVSDSGLGHLARIPCLESLHIIGGNVSHIGIRTLATAPRLFSLSFRDMPIGEQEVEAINAITTVRALNLSGAKLSGNTLSQLSCDRLERLVLDGTSFSRFSPKQSAQLRWLAVLSLAGTDISDSSLTVLSQCKNIAYLDISDTDVSDRSISAMSAMANLSMVVIRGTQITSSGVDELQTGRPGIIVLGD